MCRFLPPCATKMAEAAAPVTLLRRIGRIATLPLA
jgi:hypothetical protein